MNELENKGQQKATSIKKNEKKSSKKIENDKKKTKSKKKTKEKKTFKRDYPRWQYIFNIASLVFGLLIFVILGGRCFYYYSKLNLKIAVEAKTIASVVEQNNPIATEGDGLYKSTEGYYFKGINVNNYVWYANRLFRIISIDAENQVTLIANDNQTTMIWGDNPTFVGSNPYLYLNPTDQAGTGVFLKTLSDLDHYLANVSWCQEEVVEDKVNCGEDVTTDRVRLLTLNEYVRAGSETSYLNRGVYSWLQGIDKTGANLYIDKTGAIVSGDVQEGYGIRPVITLKAKVEVSSGNGTVDAPYRIDTENDTSKYNQYVDLGGELYRIVSEDDTKYHLAYNTYLDTGGRNYSDDSLDYDESDWSGLAYYLNRIWAPTLSYYGMLQDCTFYTGGLSNGENSNLLNIYQNSVTTKVGLLSMLDLNLNEQLNDYYTIDRTMNQGELLMIGNTEGKLLEEVMSVPKQVVPVVCINKESILSGNGSLEAPYRME